MAINIWGKYRGKSEIIDTAETAKDAAYLVGEYRLAYGHEWTVWSGRKKDDPTAKDNHLLVR